jgi:hypothetical protein
MNISRKLLRIWLTISSVVGFVPGSRSSRATDRSGRESASSPSISHPCHRHVLHSQPDLDEVIPCDPLSQYCCLRWSPPAWLVCPHRFVPELDTGHVLGDFSQHRILWRFLAGDRQAAETGKERLPNPNPGSLTIQVHRMQKAFR